MPPDQTLYETDRLLMRPVALSDATFIQRLVNEPAWLEHIGDRHIHTLADAEGYIKTGMQWMQKQHGFSLFLVVLKRPKTPIGICGLIKRNTLDDVDIGYAFLSDYWGKGYAREAARATLAFGRDTIRLSRIVAITSPKNTASKRLLVDIGLRFEQQIESTQGEALDLYAIDF